MPNHITNRVWFEGEPIDVWHAIEQFTIDGDVDFNRIYPMPESLHIQATANDVNHAKGKPWGDLPVHDSGHVEQMTRNIEEHGYAYWHDFAVDKWGTKWNAYSQSRETRPVDRDREWLRADAQIQEGCERANAFAEALHRGDELDAVLVFETAWSTPRPVFEALAGANPGVTVVVEYADEDTGSNCGISRYKGESSVHDCPTGELAYRLAYRLRRSGPHEDVSDYGDGFSIQGDAEALAYDEAWFGRIESGWDEAHDHARSVVVRSRPEPCEQAEQPAAGSVDPA